MVLVAAGAVLLVVAELVGEVVVVLLVDLVLLVVEIQRMRPPSRAMMTLMTMKVLLHRSSRESLAFNSLVTLPGAPLPQLIRFLNFFLLIKL